MLEVGEEVEEEEVRLKRSGSVRNAEEWCLPAIQVAFYARLGGQRREIESDSESDSESESPPLLPQAMPGESKSVRGIASASSVFGTAKPFRAKRPKAPGSWPHRRRPEGGEGRGWTGRGFKERGPSRCSRPHAHANRTSKIPIVPPHQRSGRRVEGERERERERGRGKGG